MNTEEWLNRTNLVRFVLLRGAVAMGGVMWVLLVVLTWWSNRHLQIDGVLTPEEAARSNVVIVLLGVPAMLLLGALWALLVVGLLWALVRVKKRVSAV